MKEKEKKRKKLFRSTQLTLFGNIGQSGVRLRIDPERDLSFCLCIEETEIMLAVLSGDKVYTTLAFRFEFFDFATGRSVDAEVHIGSVAP